LDQGLAHPGHEDNEESDNKGILLNSWSCLTKVIKMLEMLFSRMLRELQIEYSNDPSGYD
jgi:hypothetical protein